MLSDTCKLEHVLTFSFFLRIGSLDWLFSNVTADSTYQFVNSETEIDEETETNVFEMRVTNWGYG